MSSHGGLLSVCSKNFVKFCVVLSNTCISGWLYVSSGSFQRWSSYVFRVFMLHLWGFLSKKTLQKSGVIVVCSGLERIGKSLKICKNDWLCEVLENWKFLHSQPPAVKSVLHVFSHYYVKVSVDSYDCLPVEETLTYHYVIMHIKSVLNKDEKIKTTTTITK